MDITRGGRGGAVSKCWWR